MSVHPSAVVDPAAILGDDVAVGPFSVIGPHVRIGDRTRIGSHVSIEGRNSYLVGAAVLFPAGDRIVLSAEWALETERYEGRKNDSLSEVEKPHWAR